MMSEATTEAAPAVVERFGLGSIWRTSYAEHAGDLDAFRALIGRLALRFECFLSEPGRYFDPATMAVR
jgi:hypothetical protein